MVDTLLSSLEEVRDGYAEELEWHRMLLDAYSGMGGFSGHLGQRTSDFWGAASNVYAKGYETNALSRTYLDRFHRERDAKFRGRVNGAHYTNYIKPLTDLKLSYLGRKPMSVEGRPDKLDDWRQDVDGLGTRWDQLLPTIRLRAAVLGWCPVVVDMPPAPRNPDGTPAAMTRAFAEELGIRPTAVPLFPANVMDYQLDDSGFFEWVKIRTDHTAQETPFAPKTNVSRYTIWYRDRFDVFEVYESEDSSVQSVREISRDEPHDFGMVPVEILTHSPAPTDRVKGLPMHGQETVEARAHFNRQSELEEHLRGQVFAVLVLASEQNEAGGDVTIGSDNGLYLDPNASQKHYFMSPDPGVASTYETRLETTVEEIYRQARVQFARPTQSKAAVSGVARKFEFAQTDRALADFANQIARFEERIDALVGSALGIGEDQLQSIKVLPPTTFDVEDMQSDLEIAIGAINDLRIGPTASRLMRMRAITSLIPNMSEDDQSAVEEELAALEEELAQERAALTAIAMAGDDDTDTEGDTADEDQAPPTDSQDQPRA